jgi:hypothetical protein
LIKIATGRTHSEREEIAAGIAPEAIKNLLLRMNVERRMAFRVKWTKAANLRAHTSKLGELLGKRYQVHFRFQFPRIDYPHIVCVVLVSARRTKWYALMTHLAKPCAKFANVVADCLAKRSWGFLATGRCLPPFESQSEIRSNGFSGHECHLVSTCLVSHRGKRYSHGDKYIRHNNPIPSGKELTQRCRHLAYNCQIVRSYVYAAKGQEPMKAKTANLIVDEMEKMFEATGFSATQVFGAMLNAPIPKPMLKMVRLAYKANWISIFKSKPEPTEIQLAEMLAIIHAFRNAPHNMRSLLVQRVKELPHPPGGPPRKVKPEEERTLCADIVALRAECDTREAIRRVAAKRQISERTAYRIWGKHHPKKKMSAARA